MRHGEDLALTHVMLLVGDQDEAKTFYEDVIGLEVRTDMPFVDDARWLSVGPVGQPTIEFVLEVPQMAPDEARRAAARARLDGGMQSTIIFATDDVDATFTRIRDLGGTVAQPPVDQQYGRDCAFVDPWGNQIRFTGRRRG